MVAGCGEMRKLKLLLSIVILTGLWVLGSQASNHREAPLIWSGARQLPRGMQVFAGPRDRGFYLDLGLVFDLVQLRNLTGNFAPPVDSSSGFNIHTHRLPSSSQPADSGTARAPGTRTNLDVLICVCWSPPASTTFSPAFDITQNNGPRLGGFDCRGGRAPRPSRLRDTSGRTGSPGGTRAVVVIGRH